jgi:hypothetical protein
MAMDSIRMVEVMLGIPGVHVLSAESGSSGLRIEIETSVTEASCPVCDSPAEPAGRRLVELGVHSAMGQAIHLAWQQRQWRCPVPACAGSFAEEDEGIAAFLQRSPHRGADPLQQ